MNPFSVPKLKNLTLLEKYPNLNEMKWIPDGDDIGFRINTAFKIQKRIMFLNFIHLNILANDAEGFLYAGEVLKEAHE
jgi:hypothetical protein